MRIASKKTPLFGWICHHWNRGKINLLYGVKPYHTTPVRITLLIKPEHQEMPDLGPLIETLIKREYRKRTKTNHGKKRAACTGRSPKT